ncbi:hypothetical protein ACWD6I_09530 [Streptomyces sp. NPDC002454]
MRRLAERLQAGATTLYWHRGRAAGPAGGRGPGVGRPGCAPRGGLRSGWWPARAARRTRCRCRRSRSRTGGGRVGPGGRRARGGPGRRAAYRTR